MAITITLQPDSNSHFSAFNPLPIVCTSNRSGIVNIKAVVIDANTAEVYATLRKPLDIGTSTQFTIDIFPIVQSLVTFQKIDLAIHFLCTPSRKKLYVYLIEEYLSGGVLVSGSTLGTHEFFVHNVPIGYTDTNAYSFKNQFLTNAINAEFIEIGSSDSYILQAIKKADGYDGFEFLQFTVTYDDLTTNTFNDPIPWSLNERWNLSCGTHYLKNIVGANSNIQSYTVCIADLGNVPVTNSVRFVVNDSCGIDMFRLSFLNKKGAFDTFTFKFKGIKKHNIKKELWSKPKTGAGYTYDISRSETGVFKDESFEGMEVVSHPLKTTVSEWLVELLMARVVYIEYYSDIPGHYNTNLVVNGGFSSAANWTLNVDAWASLTITGGQCVLLDTVGDALGTIVQTGILTIGVEYYISLLSADNNGVQITVDGSTPLVFTPQNGTLTGTFIATSADLSIEVSCGSPTCGVKIDNVSVYVAATWQQITRIPILINDGEFTTVDNRKRENKLAFSITPANKNYNGIG